MPFQDALFLENILEREDAEMSRTQLFNATTVTQVVAREDRYYRQLIEAKEKELAQLEHKLEEQLEDYFASDLGSLQENINKLLHKEQAKHDAQAK